MASIARPAAVVQALGLRRGQVVADIGAGPGYFVYSFPGRRIWDVSFR